MEIFIPTSHDKILYIYTIKLHKNYITFYYYARIVSRKKIKTIKKNFKN